MKFRTLIPLVFACGFAALAPAQNRLKDKTEAAAPAADDWLYLDGTTNGVRKLSPFFYPSVAQVNAAIAAAVASYQPLSPVLTATTASFTTAQETKLAGIAAGATANSSDAFLLARANHTGTQPLSTLSQSGAATNQIPQWNGSAWVPVTFSGGGAVDSVNGQTGVVVLTTANIADSTNKRYVTDAHLTILGDTSGTNTGDQDLSSYLTTSAISDTAYDATSWNGVTTIAPSKNAVRDEVETLVTSIAAKVVANGSITGATKTKITYDSKGLVTSGADATTADIADSTNKRYVTDAQLVVIGNTSGTNTGDQDLSGYVPTTRTISTTSPLSGGGDLSANRTIAIADAAADGTTKGASTYNASDFDATSGVISLDYANGQKATGSVSGFLLAADWTTFNSKQPAGSYLTSVTANAPLSGSGTSGSHLVIAQSTTSTDGYLSSTDWNTFNGKQAAGSYLTAVTADSPLSGSGTSGSHLVVAQATTSTSGYLSSTDWNTFNGKQSALSLGTGVTTALGVNVGTDGAFVVKGGSLGAPSSGDGTNLTLPHSITFVVAGGATPLTTGVQDLILNTKYSGTLTSWSVTASPADTITFDILRSADGGAAPSSSIVGGSGTKPNLASGVNGHSTSFSNWTSTTVTAYDNFKCQITAVGGVCTSATVTLYFQ